MITQALIGLGFKPLVDFIAQDDGQGVYIKEWLSDKPKPTDAELEKGLGLFQEKEKLELRKQAISQYMDLVKQELINSFEDVTREEMIEFTSALAEFNELGQLKLERYPLAAQQIQEWITQDKLPQLP